MTGFGLLGHLGEMLTASGAALEVELDGAAIPAHPGALELLGQGFASSLAPANAAALALLEGPVVLRPSPGDSARDGRASGAADRPPDLRAAAGGAAGGAGAGRPGGPAGGRVQRGRPDRTGAQAATGHGRATSPRLSSSRAASGAPRPPRSTVVQG